MIPILYPSSYKDLVDFNNNGLGFLTEATKVQVSEVLNGKFDIYIEYPISGRLFRDITSDTFVKVKPNSKDEPHIFRIYETEIRTEQGIVSIEGTSITFDLVGNMVLDVKVRDATPSDAWRALEAGALDPIKHRFNSDITARSNGEWTRTNLLYCISGEEGSMLQKWGGEIKRENFQISLFRRRGRDNVTTIRHGKNMEGFTATYSTKGIVTAIVPVTTIYNSDSSETIDLVGNIVYSPLANKYPINYYAEVIFTEEDGVVDMASLNAKAARFFTERPNHDTPSINVVIDMIDLSDSPEFYKFKDFENIEIGDTVTVYSKRFDMNLTSKVISIVYNALLEINESIELGTSRASAYEYYKQMYSDTVASVVKPIDERVNMVQIAANGKNRVFRGVPEPTTGMVKNDLWYKPVGDGETMMYVFDGDYWQLNKVSAGLLGGTLDAGNGDVDLINVNVANIVGDTSEFVRSAWNGIASRITIDGDEILTIDNSGRYVTLGNGGMKFGGGGEEIVLRNNTGENPNRSGISLNPVRDTMNAVDFDINTRGNSALHMGTSDLDLGYRLRLANEEQNKNNYYISLKTGKRFSFELDKNAAGTSTKNAMEVEVMDASGTIRVGRNPQHGSSMWLVNDDVIFAKGGTNNRVSVFAGRFAGQSFNYLEADKIYSIEKTISSILGWIGKDGQWVEND